MQVKQFSYEQLIHVSAILMVHHQLRSVCLEYAIPIKTTIPHLEQYPITGSGLLWLLWHLIATDDASPTCTISLCTWHILLPND